LGASSGELPAAAAANLVWPAAGPPAAGPPGAVGRDRQPRGLEPRPQLAHEGGDLEVEALDLEAAAHEEDGLLEQGLVLAGEALEGEGAGVALADLEHVEEDAQVPSGQPEAEQQEALVDVVEAAAQVAGQLRVLGHHGGEEVEDVALRQHQGARRVDAAVEVVDERLLGGAQAVAAEADEGLLVAAEVVGLDDGRAALLLESGDDPGVVGERDHHVEGDLGEVVVDGAARRRAVEGHRLRLEVVASVPGGVELGDLGQVARVEVGDLDLHAELVGQHLGERDPPLARELRRQRHAVGSRRRRLVRQRDLGPQHEDAVALADTVHERAPVFVSHFIVPRSLGRTPGTDFRPPSSLLTEVRPGYPHRIQTRFGGGMFTARGSDGAE